MSSNEGQSDPAAQERIVALDHLDILDTEAEPGFDDIVMLASQMCDAPVALVSLVARDRQWFKARIGFPASETPLSQSVCAHALRQSETLVIPDLTLDDRTRHNTLVTRDPFIRFYAGALLHTSEGLPIGTLCVIDTKPRPQGLTQSQIACLEALARQVMAQLELRGAIVQRDRAAAEKLAAAAAAKRHQELLSRELSHRLKNILAIVQAIALQTLRNATSLATAREALSTRIVALGKAHEILFEGSAESATIAAIVHEAAILHDGGDRQCFRISGPDIQVGAKAALMLALMIHELATNAAKYGALSAPNGTVTISWDLSAANGSEPVVTLSWRESGGPPVTVPTRTGFGTQLIERALAGTVGGVATLAYPVTGLTCELRAPLSGFHDPEERRLRGEAA